MAQPKIGFIGLGLMGAAMVERLQAKGYSVCGLGNSDRTGIDAAIARGGTEAKSGREVAEQSDIVMLCMGTSDHVEGRMLGDDGVIAGLKSGGVVIDFGTSLPSSTRMLGEKVAAAGGTYLDGPLGRTPAHAVDGLLNIMCSGDKAAFDRIKPVLDDLGENVFHLGALGSGHTIKLINNFFGMTTAMAMSEAFAMADIAGIDRSAVYDVMAAGPLKSGMMDFVKGYAIDGDPAQLAFAVKNAAKDVGYYEVMSQDAGAPTKMAGAALSVLKAGVDAGYGDRMASEMTDFFSATLKT